MSKRTKPLLLLLACFALVGCSTTPKEPSLVDASPYTSFPIKPEMRTLTRPPIIAKQGNDYLVTDEFVERMVVLSEYMEKVDEWKAVNSVP